MTGSGGNHGNHGNAVCVCQSLGGGAGDYCRGSKVRLFICVSGDGLTDVCLYYINLLIQMSIKLKQTIGLVSFL